LSIKQNQTPREYLDIGGFELRIGKFYDPNENLNGPKMEIRILKPIKEDDDFALFEALEKKLKEWLSTHE